MWAYSIVSLCAVTVPAQDLEALGEVVVLQPSVDLNHVPVLLFHLPPMVGAIVVDVVDGEELQCLLTATGALGASVGIEHQFLEAPLTLSARFSVSITVGVVLGARPSLAPLAEAFIVLCKGHSAVEAQSVFLEAPMVLSDLCPLARRTPRELALVAGVEGAIRKILFAACTVSHAPGISAHAVLGNNKELLA
ncbi:MAG: hypothetical protein HKO76_08970 [Acidimicrobiia bacterium]|nr:hypothetical protein [Acidimicrobiia bacterium]